MVEKAESPLIDTIPNLFRDSFPKIVRSKFLVPKMLSNQHIKFIFFNFPCTARSFVYINMGAIPPLLN